MKIVVLGGSGFVGSQVVARLVEGGHEAVAASPRSGVNTLTGQGLQGVLEGADVVVDVTDSPSSGDAAALDFFRTSTGNVIAAEVEAGVGHHVALSIVGADRLPDSGYLRAKVAQEQLIKESSIPSSIVRATPFYEFLVRMADSFMVEGAAHAAGVAFRPVASRDVAATVAEVAVGTPVNGIVELAGPQELPMDEFIRKGLAVRGDKRIVVTDAQARYYGAIPLERSLVPGVDARIGPTTFMDWAQSAFG